MAGSLKDSGDVGPVLRINQTLDLNALEIIMSQGASLYPISQSLARIVRNSGYSNYGFCIAFSMEAELPNLESWLEKAEGPDGIIGAICTAFPDESEALRKAVAETASMKVAGVDPVQLEQEKAEKAFRPFLLAVGEERVPTQITIFGVTGGFDTWQLIRVPKSMIELPLDQQLPTLRELMEAYKRKYSGNCPFFGRLVAFRFVRYRDHFLLNLNGDTIEHVEHPFIAPACFVELR